MEPDDSPQHQRARRIADEIWELWREEVVRLYIEGAELQEIPKVMAEEHQFFITTAQLKDQFRKWQVKKNFSKQELAWMASEKRKRGALGKRARFQQHGHEVEEERLERALKRHRSQIYTPEFPPISLKLVATPTRSPQLAQVAPETETSPISAPQFGDRTNTHPTMPSLYDSHLEIASIVPRLDHASLEDVVGNDMRASRDTMGSTPHSEWFAVEPLGSLPNGSNYQIPLAALNEIEQILRSPLAEGGNLMLSRAGSAQSRHSDWRRFFNLSPTTRSRSRTFGSLISSPRQSQPGDPYPPQEQWEWHISPSIRTFNVVPKHAEIFTRLRMNDVQGIHSLFDARKASPRDVDESGFSLLSYIQPGGEDVLELLLLGGANAQNVNWCASRADVISTMWGHFLDYGYGPYLQPTTLNECIRMSNIALAQGCDVSGNESVRANEHATPLFVMSCGSLNSSDTKTAREAIDALLNMGFDAEERNSKGLTPLLYTASMCTPIVVKSLEALVWRNVNLKTTDPQGKGALHFALGAPYFVDGWPNFELEDDWPCDEYGPCRQRSCRLRSCLGYLSLQCTICIVHGREFDAEHQDSEPLETPVPVALRPADTPWSQNCIEDLTKDEFEDWVSSMEDDDSPALTADDDHSSGAANHSFTDGHGIYELEDSDPDSPARTAEDDHSSEGANHFWDPDNTSGHRYWRFIRRHIIPMLKRRMRFKVLTLLQAGCDPNHLDNNGESPSAFAQREGILPEWTWALQKSGYVYDKNRGLWKRTTVFA